MNQFIVIADSWFLKERPFSLVDCEEQWLIQLTRLQQQMLKRASLCEAPSPPSLLSPTFPNLSEFSESRLDFRGHFDHPPTSYIIFKDF